MTTEQRLTRIETALKWLVKNKAIEMQHNQAYAILRSPIEYPTVLELETNELQIGDNICIPSKEGNRMEVVTWIDDDGTVFISGGSTLAKNNKWQVTRD